MEIKKTKNYEMFKGIVGNREVRPVGVANLTKAIMHKNMLALNPIIVNEKMEVIDGQHRLEVAKNNMLDIYYVVASEGNLEDIQMLNANMRPWTGKDYLHSYVSVGKPAYVLIKELMEEYSLPLSHAVSIVSGDGGGVWTKFKRGTINIIHERSEIEMLAQAFSLIRPYIQGRAYMDREFVRAFIKTLESVSAEDLIVKLESSNLMIEPETHVRDYIRQFEDILNWKNRSEFVRLEYR